MSQNPLFIYYSRNPECLGGRRSRDGWLADDVSCCRLLQLYSCWLILIGDRICFACCWAFESLAKAEPILPSPPSIFSS
eukprot:COSAG01_NODE_7745_length_3075_cov_1.975806_4_plen_79_part_00